jgi:hypothetical protein
MQYLEERLASFPTANPELIASWLETIKVMHECEIKGAYINGQLTKFDDFKDRYKNADDYYNLNFKK